MNPDDIAAELPAPRDDEPQSLRRDIVDELADHLQCALHRELLAGEHSSPSQQASPRRESGDSDIEHTACQHPQADAWGSPVHAWQQVLTRFGNPASIARRLWFDAMKERLMAQKITATMATLAAGACIVMAVLVWQSTLRDSDAQRRLLAQQQELNRTLLAELKSLHDASSTAAATTAGWAPVKVRLQSEDGQPVAGKVTIQGTAINAGNDNEINVSRTTDEEGVTDFGLLPFGNYELEVVASAVGEQHRRSFMLSPNTLPELTIVCPTEPPPAVEVSFAIDVPPPLHADRLVFFAAFVRSSRVMSSGTWHVESTDDRRFNVLIDAEGTILGEVSNTKVIEDDSRTFGASVNPAAADFLRESGRGPSFLRESGRGPSDVTRRYEGRLVPARSIRATDRCVGLGVAALPADHVDDGTIFRYVLATWPYTVEDAAFEGFPDTDPSEDTMRIEFAPPSSFWEMVVAAFRRSEEVADVTIPEGWQVVKVPADVRIALGAAGRSRSGRGSTSQSPPQVLRLQVVTKLEEQQLDLPVGVGDVMGPTQMPDSVRSPNAFRELMDGSRKVDVDLLVSPELAEAIELARRVGTLEGARLPDEDVEGVDENGVNQQTLKTLRELAAEQPAAKDK